MTNNHENEIIVEAEGIEPSLRNHLFITLRYPSRSHAPLKLSYAHAPDRQITKYKTL